MLCVIREVTRATRGRRAVDTLHDIPDTEGHIDRGPRAVVRSVDKGQACAVFHLILVQGFAILIRIFLNR